MKNRFTDSGSDYTDAEVKTLFGPHSNAKLAMQIHREQPDVYRAVRLRAQQMGLIGDSMEKYAPTPHVDPNAARQYTSEELSARQLFDEQTVREYFKQGWSGTMSNNLATIAKERPAEYQLIKLAAVSYGILDKTAIRPTPPPKPAEPPAPTKMELSEDLCRRAHLPIGTMVTHAELGKINENVISHERFVAQREAEQRKAAEAEVGEQN